MPSENEYQRWSDGVILEVKQELGETKGRIMSIETTMKETRDDVKEILKNVAAIPEMQRMIIQHDRRIGDLEQKGVAYDAVAEKVEKHLAEDEPTGHYVDRNIAAWVKRGAWVAVTGLIGWCVARVTGK
jgi:aminoglycoside phosphotransferase (APT) family kinase protein